MRMWRRWMACGLSLALVGLVAVCWTRAADEKKMDEKKMAAPSDLDALLYKSLRNAINHGADLYNLNRDFAGCYRVYEGALLTVQPLLGHRPNLQKAIDTALANARGTANPVDRCWALRDVLDQIRKEIGPEKGEMKDKDQPKKDEKPAKDKDKDKPAPDSLKPADKDKDKDKDKVDKADKDKEKDKDKTDKADKVPDSPKDGKDKDSKDNADKDKPKDKADKDKPKDKTDGS